VLNIKDIAIKMQGEGPKRMVVKKQGPGVVTAGDIQTVGDVVVLNRTSRSARSTRAPRSAWSSRSRTGKGYVPAERNRPEDAPIGLIRSTACTRRSAGLLQVETPVRGRSSTTDKLTMTIETNGALTPE